jgi:serine/threonine protein kinase
LDSRLIWLCGMAEALQGVHMCGLVHCDIGLDAFCFPSGFERPPVLFTWRKLKKEGTFPGEDFPTDGEVPYVGPELRETGTATQQSDIYALGVTYFMVLTHATWNPASAIN